MTHYYNNGFEEDIFMYIHIIYIYIYNMHVYVFMFAYTLNQNKKNYLGSWQPNAFSHFFQEF